MVFCDWLLLLRTLLSRFIHIVACISTYSFLWLNNIPLYGYTTFCLSSSISQHFSCFFWILCIRLLWTFVYKFLYEHLFSILLSISVQLLSCVRLFATPWTAAHQASLSITNSQSLLKFMSIKLMMPSNHLILCHPLLFPPSIFPSIRVFSSSLHQMAKVLEFQLQHQSFQWIFRTDFLYDWLVWSLCSPRDSQESSPTPHFKSINSSALSFLYNPTLTFIYG